MRNYCCVQNCASKRRIVKLHRFPKNEIGLKWLQCINCDKLKNLSLSEIHRMFVCDKHFERRFVNDNTSRLKMAAYPTLFTNAEIETGIPTQVYESYENHDPDHDYTRKRKHVDHSYYKLKLQSEHDNSMPSISKSGKYILRDKMNQQLILDNSMSITPESESSKLINSEKTNQEPVSEIQQRKKTNKIITRKICLDKTKKTLRYKKIQSEFETSKNESNVSKRAKSALNFNKKENFEKLTSKMNPLAKKILWLQVKQCGRKVKGRRFTDEENIIDLSVMKQSPKSYKFLRRIFILTSVRTINKLLMRLNVETGINSQIFEAIKLEVSEWPNAKKYCSIIFDEIVLEAGLTYEKNKDYLCGLVEFDSKTKSFADHAIVFMIRGALYKWQQPIAFYFCEGSTSGHILKGILKELVTEIVKTGLHPVALICDQGTSFQAALNCLKQETGRTQILTAESIDDTVNISDHKLHIIFDPPHLIKGLRNNFLTKDIEFEEKISKWSDIVDVYLTDCKHAEMRLLHKLNDEYVIPNKIKKMKVKNCTRVLSNTVASALTYTAQFSHYADGRPVSTSLKDTAKTVSFFDSVFDSCNGSTTTSKNKGKPLRQAVTHSSKHEMFWKKALKKMEDIRFINKEGKKIIVPSQKNFITTLKSMLQLWKFFKDRGFKIMRPRYFNSDPIENFFGQIRAYSFRNNNPNCQAFKNIFRSFLITRFMHFHSDSYNCEDSTGQQIIKLKNLFEQNQETRKRTVLSSCESDLTMATSDNIQVEARKERLNIHSRAYSAGWVVRKCLIKFNCVECKSCLTQNNVSSIHRWITYREFAHLKNKQKLTYPSEYAVRYFSYFVKEANKYLELKPNANNISQEIKDVIKSKYSFDFLTCESHKKALLEYFIVMTVKLSIYNWCNIINKILRGVDVVRINKQLPCMQANALKKLKKKLKIKNINK